MIRPRDEFALPESAAVAEGQGSPIHDREPPAVAEDGGDPAAWIFDRLPPELEYFRTSEAYQVELEEFNGPLDLLLYLIQKDQLDIYDIPIAQITDQYLKYIELIQLLPLDNAGDFLVMAATLVRIKTSMLLPVSVEEEFTEEDPRAELVRRLLEYKRFKEAAAELRKCEEKRNRYHLRQTRYPFLDRSQVELPLRIEMFDLLAALAGVFDRLTSPSTHLVVREPYTVEQKMELIRKRLSVGDTLHFQELFDEDAIKMEVIVTFVALLELVRQQMITAFQTEVHGPIWIKRHENAATWFDTAAADTVEPGHDGGDELLGAEAQG